MKAIVFDAPGQPEDFLRVREAGVPLPASGEVLVRTAAVSWPDPGKERVTGSMFGGNQSRRQSRCHRRPPRCVL